MKIKFFTACLVAFLGICTLNAQGKYTDGVFILNEDWFGKNNSTINFLNTATKEFDYLLIQNNSENGKLSLGCTAQFGAIYGDNLYVISKQDQDKGEGKLQGGRIVVADVESMKIKKSIPVIHEIKGKSAADGRSFVGVDETKAYIGTSNGIFIFDLNTFEIKGQIGGTGNPLATGDEDNSDGLGPLYKNQIGMMIRSLNYVFAIQQDKGVLVIDPESDTVKTIIAGCFSTMTQSKDGTIWVGKNSNMDYQTYPYGDFGATGEKWEGDQLLKIDPQTLETSTLQMPASYGLNQTWYAWTAGSLCASAQHNRLYFTYNPNKWSWFTTSYMYMYDIDSNTFTKIYDTTSEQRYFYGSSIRINPLDDKIYASLYLDNVNQTYFFYQLDNEGKKLNQYEPIKRYWFPALFIFPDNYAPEVTDFEPVYLASTEDIQIDLSEMATDKDNLDVAITKKIISINNENIKAKIENNQLTITPETMDIEDGIITVRFNSNGKIKDRNIHINPTVWPPVSVEEVYIDPISVFVQNGSIAVRGLQASEQVNVYTLQGQLVHTQTMQYEGNIDGLPAGQVYMLKIKNNTYKVLL